MLATCAQVSITALALIAATTAIAFSRFDLGNSENAFKAVVRSPRTQLVISPLVLAAIGSILLLLSVPDSTSGIPKQIFFPLAIIIGQSIIGIMGAVLWVVNAHSILGVVPMLGTLIQLIPKDWVNDANRYATKWYNTEKGRAETEGRPIGIHSKDIHTCTLNPVDPFSRFIDTMSCWISQCGMNKPIAADVSLLLTKLSTSLKRASPYLSGTVLPIHLRQLLDASVKANNPQVVLAVLRFFREVHASWEESGDKCVRINQANWVLPPLFNFWKARGYDQQGFQLIEESFRINMRSCDGGESPLLRQVHIYIWNLYNIVHSKLPEPAKRLWQLLDGLVRRRGPAMLDPDIISLLNIVKEARVQELRVYDLGYLSNWIAIGLLQAASEAEKRGNSDWAILLRERIRDVFSELGCELEWAGKSMPYGLKSDKHDVSGNLDEMKQSSTELGLTADTEQLEQDG